MDHIPPKRGRIVAVSDYKRPKMLDCLRVKKAEGLIQQESDWKTYDTDLANVR